MTKLGNWMLLTILGAVVFAFGGTPALVGYGVGYFFALILIVSTLD